MVKGAGGKLHEEEERRIEGKEDQEEGKNTTKEMIFV